jgi:predicted phage tail protein
MDDSFTFNGVPAGTYTFSLRAVNAIGTSGPSSPVTLSFPAACSGRPQRPVGVVASRNGAVISLAWQPAASGAAPTSYVVNVTGALTLAVPTAARSVSGAVGPGTYTFRVDAVNACGSSAASTSATVVIP